jgi:segregation and condensation protein A
MIAYEVRLSVFEGPLDLLLHLIEREELDITAVSLAQVTDQYLDYIGRLEERSAAHLADFLVVASKLLLIKSRLLLPSPPVAHDEEEDEVGEDLVRQLIEYKKYKDVARLLARREEQALRAYVRVGPVPVAARGLNLEGVSAAVLAELVRQALHVPLPAPPVATVIPPVTVSLGDKMGLIRAALRAQQEVDFGELVGTACSRVEVIVTLLAVLELIKEGSLAVEQEELFGRILLRSQPEGAKVVEELIEPEPASEG